MLAVSADGLTQRRTYYQRRPSTISRTYGVNKGAKIKLGQNEMATPVKYAPLSFGIERGEQESAKKLRSNGDLKLEVENCEGRK